MNCDIKNQDPYVKKVSASNGHIPLQRDPDVTSNIEVYHTGLQSCIRTKAWFEKKKTAGETVGETAQKKIQHVLYFHAPVPAGSRRRH